MHKLQTNSEVKQKHIKNSQKIEKQTQESRTQLRAIITELRAIKFTCVGNPTSNIYVGVIKIMEHIVVSFYSAYSPY